VPFSKKTFAIALTVLLANFCFSTHAQERCGTVEHALKQTSPAFFKERNELFEKWIVRKADITRMARSKTSSYTIPVVVHVIHNGEAVGTGTNISTEQILSQIKVLNDDYRRQNADAVNTPAIFTSVAGSMDIEFMLAKRDPEGHSTTGIVRVQGSKTDWTTDDNYELKSLSYWPAEDYLNLWVCNITDFLGYAQFPVSDLPGLEGSSSNRLTDGVVLWYRAFGSDDDGNFSLDPDYNKGRTATHEISHFFGLRHIWGDEEGCSGTDYVDDTPNQATYTSGCPSTQPMSCGTTNMMQNFIDYTDDACMNLFTKGQVERMQIVIENSPRRSSLLTSPGALPPDPFPNDLGLRKIVSPAQTQCTTALVPVVQVKNYGSNYINTARITVKLNGAVVQTTDLVLNLAPLDSTDITFDTLNGVTGNNTLSFEILLTNGLADADAIGNENILTIDVLIPASIALPFTESFTTFPAGWIISNPDQQITWELAQAPNQNTNNSALVLRFYDYENNFGEQDILYTPVFDLSATETATLLFDVAHARYDLSNDRLKIVAITGCRPISEGIVIYDSAGIHLSTSTATTSSFKPNNANDWQREIITMNDLAGEQFVQLAFIGLNDYGNNLYLDNISVITSPFRDLNFYRISSPSIVTCNEVNSPVMQIQNTGTEEITSVDVSYSITNVASGVASFPGLSLSPGEEMQLTLPPITFSEGENNLVIEVSNINGMADSNDVNNKQEMKVVVDHSEDRIPLRQTFELSDTPWTIVSPTDGMLWQTIPTNYGTSLYYNAFANTTIGDEAWLVSPVLDFSRATEASMLFDLSYATRESSVEDLKIYVSRDCGASYKLRDFALPDVSSSTGNWAPQDEDDWLTKQMDLSDLAGLTDVRIAFAVTNGNGNNLYLDNIEFFVTDEPRDVTIDTQFAIFGYNMQDISQSELKVGFNLARRQDVKCQVVDRMGKTVNEIVWTDVLNQVFELPLRDDVASGVYIVRLGINNTFFGNRILIMRD
jgi:hypothetical protein